MIGSELAMCKYMGWTYEALMNTPLAVVDRLLYQMKQESAD